MELNDFCKHNNISIEVGSYITRKPNMKIRCKCGDFKILKKSPQSKYGLCLYSCCGKKECEPNYGKKRPMHSIHMKKLAQSDNYKYRNTLMKKNELFNKEVNTDSFKIKVLNNNYIYDPKLDVKDQYSDFLSKRVKTKSYRAKLITTFNKKHSIPSLNYNELIALTDEKFKKEFFEYKSKHHEIYCNNSGSKKFIRSLLTNLKYNTRNLSTVYTKSSYETNYINYFENNKIEWDYEPIKFKFENVSYKPDFLIKYKNNEYLIEVKGFLINEEEYFQNKMIPLFNKIKNEKLPYCLLFTYDYKPTKDFDSFIERNKFKC